LGVPSINLDEFDIAPEIAALVVREVAVASERGIEDALARIYGSRT
jgi:hypothetical protein